MRYRCPSEYSVNDYQEKLNVFGIIKRKDGIYPAIITVDGFLNEDIDDIEGWEIAVKKKYPLNAWYHLNWQSENTKKLLRRTVYGIGMASILSAFALMIPLPMMATGLIGVSKTWSNALRMTEKAGALLSKVLLNCENDGFILIGHSLGSRVIYNCLDNLRINEKKIIYDVHLLGGAVSNNYEKWSLAEKAVKNKIYNYYSKNDKVLQIPYKLGAFDSNPIGRTIIQTSKSSNINVTELVNSHMTFKKTFQHYIK